MFEEDENKWSLDISLPVRRRFKKRKSVSFSHMTPPPLLYFEYRYAVKDSETGRFRIEDLDENRRVYFDAAFLSQSVQSEALTADTPVTVEDSWEVLKTKVTETAEALAEARARKLEEEELKKQIRLDDKDLNIRPDDRLSRSKTVDMLYSKLVNSFETDPLAFETQLASMTSDLQSSSNGKKKVAWKESVDLCKDGFAGNVQDGSSANQIPTRKRKGIQRRTIGAANPIGHFFGNLASKKGAGIKNSRMGIPMPSELTQSDSKLRNSSEDDTRVVKTVEVPQTLDCQLL
eukprot:TRINITY_DN5759_c0_g2_i1.p1 TRINITY_DN5759_c0_g2~~TRINITY_DN5759_c0_g2_i1.p1  ORF type:complete len:298 (-),score=43.91 TRINITY_DN5759_c0_g2_i1:380-1249(-)